MDPHFVGFDGSKFDFGGEDRGVYAVYSDHGVQVNTELGMMKLLNNGTWIKAVGIVTQGTKVAVHDSELHINNKVVTSSGSYSFDDAEVNVEFFEGRLVTVDVRLPTLAIKISHHAAGASYYMDLSFALSVMPENPHGVLGQTARALAGVGVFNGIIEGAEEDYRVTDLLSTAFAYSTYMGNLHRRSVPMSMEPAFTASAF